MSAVIANAEFKLDLSAGEKRGDNKLDRLTENTLSSLVSHSNTLNEIYQLKDELLQYDLPPSFLLQTLLLTSRTNRSFSDLSSLVKELIRIVYQYSVPWEEKGEPLKQLRKDYLTKQNQLSLAIKQLEMVAVQEEQMKQERRLNQWMRLYMRTMASKTVGRRWKFRIEPFKRRIAKGGNPYDSESESDNEDNIEAVHHSLTPSDVEDDELREQASDKASELSRALSSKLGDALKKVRFTEFEDMDSGPGETSPTNLPRPLVETSDTSSWTKEPEFDYYLTLIMYRPQGVSPRKELVCTVSLAENMSTSKPYTPSAAGIDHLEDYQVFRFPLSDHDAKYLPCLLEDPTKETDRYLTPKLGVAVYPNNIANDLAARCSIPVSKITLNGSPLVIIPPVINNHPIQDHDNEMMVMDWGGKHGSRATDTNLSLEAKSDVPLDTGDDDELTAGSGDGTKPWEPDWEGLVQQVMIQDPEPVSYPLKLLQDPSMNEDDEDDSTPCVPLITQVIKVQRLQQFEVSLSTQPWESLMHQMGYKKLTETESVALSALYLDPSKATTPAETPVPQEVIEEEEEGKLSAAEVAQLTLKHAEELNQLQDQYNTKLQALSKTLAKVKYEKQKEIEELEQALIQSEATKSQHRMRSPSELKEMLARKKRLNKLTKGLPEWGKNLPENFYERLELFAYESMKKNAEMTEKIKREVKEVCERQLASLHRLAPIPGTGPPNSIHSDVCIPAQFMPTPSSRPSIIFNPRAYQYFHPHGSSEHRVSQPPAIFKLPPIQPGSLATLNLYEQSQQDQETIEKTMWLQSNAESPRYTPAPPPSACDYYLPPPTDRKYTLQQSSQQQQEN